MQTLALFRSSERTKLIGSFSLISSSLLLLYYSLWLLATVGVAKFFFLPLISLKTDRQPWIPKGTPIEQLFPNRDLAIKIASSFVSVLISSFLLFFGILILALSISKPRAIPDEKRGSPLS